MAQGARQTLGRLLVSDPAAFRLEKFAIVGDVAEIVVGFSIDFGTSSESRGCAARDFSKATHAQQIHRHRVHVRHVAKRSANPAAFRCTHAAALRSVHVSR